MSPTTRKWSPAAEAVEQGVHGVLLRADDAMVSPGFRMTVHGTKLWPVISALSMTEV